LKDNIATFVWDNRRQDIHTHMTVEMTLQSFNFYCYIILSEDRSGRAV
jgi:hypothetical protein